MNLLNKELIGIAVLIVVLYTIRQYLPKKQYTLQRYLPKKEGFMAADQIGIVAGGVLFFVAVVIGVAYLTYKVKA